MPKNVGSSTTTIPRDEPSAFHFQLYHMLDVHVYETNLAVIRKLWRKMKKIERKRRDKREIRKAMYRGVLECHKRALELVRKFRL